MMLSKKIILLFGLLIPVFPFLQEIQIFPIHSVIFVMNLLIGSLFLAFLCTEKGNKIDLTWNDFLIFLFLIYGVINAVFLSDLPDDILLSKWTYALFVYLFLRNAHSPELEKIYYIIAFSGLLQSLYGLIQLSYILESNHPLFHLTGSFFNPGPYGGYLSICAVICIHLIVQSSTKKRSRTILLYIVLSIICCALFFSDSRAAWLALFIPVSISLWTKLNKKVTRIFTLVGVLIISGIALFLLYQYRPISADARLGIWNVCARIIVEKPITGHGIGSLPALYMPAQSDFLTEYPDKVHVLPSGTNSYAFNEFIHLTCELGFIGLILFLCILILAFATRSNDPSKETAKYGLLSILIFSCFSYPADPYSLFFFFPFFMGILQTESRLNLLLPMPDRLWKVISIGVVGFVIVFSSLRWKTHGDLQRMVDKALENRDPDVLDDFVTLSRFPENSEMNFMIGDVLFRLQDYRRAILYLEKSLKTNVSSQVLLQLGQAYLHEKSYSEAEKQLINASRMAPLLILPRYNLFLLYRETGRLEEARKLAVEIIQMNVKVVNSITIGINSEMRSYLSDH